MKFKINIPLGSPDPEARLKRIAATVERFTNPLDVELQDPIEDAIARIFAGDTNIPEEIGGAFYIYMNDTRRSALEAFLLAGGDLQDIRNFLGIPEGVTTIYREYFFEIDVLKTRLDTEDYIRQICHQTNGAYSEFHQNLKRAALEMGLDYLKSRFNDKYEIPADVALARSIRLAYVKLCETERAPAGSKLAEVARRNAKLLIDNVKAKPTLAKIAEEEHSEEEIQWALKARQLAGDTEEAEDIDNSQLLH